MIKPIFGKRKPKVDEKKAKDQAMQQAIKNREKDDPLVGLKIGAMELKANLMEMLKDTNGVRVEDAFGILGSLAGNMCLMYGFLAVRSGLNTRESNTFHIIGAKNGQKYYLGSLINSPLLEDKMSVWSLIAGMAQDLGATNEDLPNIEDILAHTISTFGDDDSFGIPRLPEKHKLRDTPENFVKHLSPKLIPIVTRYTQDARAMPALIAMAIQGLMKDAKNIIDPSIAALIVMECAIPMSRCDVNGYITQE